MTEISGDDEEGMWVQEVGQQQLGVLSKCCVWQLANHQRHETQVSLLLEHLADERDVHLK